MSSDVTALLNGAPPDAASGAALMQSRGLHYGDGVFRTLLRHGGRLIDQDLQFAKLRHDAGVLGLDAPPAELLATEAQAVAGDVDACVLKILLWRSGAGRGYRSESRAAERLLLRYPLPQFPPTVWTEGIRAFVCATALSEQPLLAGIKHLNRLEQVLAGREWPTDAQEGIQLSAAGVPLCGTRSNLFWITHGRLCTPELVSNGVAGVMRDRLLTLAHELRIGIEVASFPLDALMNADEAFVTNSLIGIWPLRALGERQWTAPGALSRRLMQALRHPLIPRLISGLGPIELP